MPKHTPGPWYIAAGSPKPHVVAGAFDVLLSNPDGADAEIWQANAHLIAAAPEMYAACKAVSDFSVLRTQRFAEDSDTDYFLRVIEELKELSRAVIAKAEGRHA